MHKYVVVSQGPSKGSQDKIKIRGCEWINGTEKNKNS